MTRHLSCATRANAAEATERRTGNNRAGVHAKFLTNGFRRRSPAVPRSRAVTLRCPRHNGGSLAETKTAAVGFITKSQTRDETARLAGVKTSDATTKLMGQGRNSALESRKLREKGREGHVFHTPASGRTGRTLRCAGLTPPRHINSQNRPGEPCGANLLPLSDSHEACETALPKNVGLPLSGADSTAAAPLLKYHSRRLQPRRRLTLNHHGGRRPWKLAKS